MILSKKIHANDVHTFSLVMLPYRFITLLDKHIYLVDHRLLKGKQIPRQEKMFSIFEDYTEWVNKGKSRSNVELGKKVSITTDQHRLMLDHQIMKNCADFKKP